MSASSLQRMVRRLRWLAVAQVALFIYGLVCVGAIVSLARADRWEAYVLMPLESGIIFVLWNWGCLVAKSPNARISEPPEGGNDVR